MKRFKFNTLTILLCVSLIIMSCSSDDSDTNNPTIDPNADINPDLLIGDWRFTKDVDYYDGIEEIYEAQCPSELILSFTSNVFYSKVDFDCDGTIDEEMSASYVIIEENGFKNVIFSQGQSQGAIINLSASNLIIRDEYFIDASTNEEAYFDLYFTKF